MTELIERQKRWTKIVAKAWADNDYKARLLADPAAVLAKEGLTVPEGVSLRVAEAADGEAVLVIPAKPSGHEAGEMDVERLAAGPSATI